MNVKHLCMCVSVYVNHAHTHKIVAHQAPLSWDSSGKNTCLKWVATSPSQGIFPIQGSSPGLLHCKQILYHIIYPFTY